VATLLQHQPDIHECGRLFSYTFIYLMNVLGIGLWIVLVSPATLEQVMELLLRHGAAALCVARDVAGVLVARIRLQ
jgi:hypothetical protein